MTGQAPRLRTAGLPGTRDTACGRLSGMFHGTPRKIGKGEFAFPDAGLQEKSPLFRGSKAALNLVDRHEPMCWKEGGSNAALG